MIPRPAPLGPAAAADAALAALGWSDAWAAAFEPYALQGLVPGRVTREDKLAYTVVGAAQTWRAALAGRLRHTAEQDGIRPAVGDWVALLPRPGEDAASVQAVLPRRSAFTRKTAGAVTAAQVVAANVDWVLLVCGLDGDFSVRRLERYLTLAWNSGASPVIVLNKTDVCGELTARLVDAETVALGVPVHAVSALAGDGLDALQRYVAPGQTSVLLGSSGVGKSSLINALIGSARQRVNAVLADDSRGRHTTTHRELIQLDGGGVIIDTPGMRELQLWSDEEALDGAFGDIEALAAGCRYRDCRHECEPGCAVRAAVATGTLPAARLASYEKLKRELRHLARQTDHRARLEERNRWKRITMEVRWRTRGR